ncbi:xanthine/uracil permease [Spiroplasma corruscae]|uniref:Xanthine/uracil permease n=1 Tax=Spiroplasma corruscae TaxID=216934 RepID=A0A222EN14_9MOLU|nr:NCS2 family permease [Spiroplasma corruscae]ASP27900.1 xanthine/uracil permease [Spiroplasma corruscae]
MKKLKKNDDFNIERTKDEIVNNSKRSFIPRYFKFDSLKATFKKEIIGGLSTFLAMVYILSVEPTILSGADGINGDKMSYGGVFVATAISSFICTLLMGLFANLPVGVAPSMGLNAMFTFNIANSGNIGYEGALIATMISSILFTVISITKLRSLLIKCIPHSMHLAFGVGIGFFIAYVGLTNIGWFATKDGIPIASLSKFKENYIGIIVGMIILFGSIILFFKKFIAPVAIMMLVGFIFAIILANTVDDIAVSTAFGVSKWDGWHYSDFSGFWYNIKNSYSEIGNVNIWNKPVMYVSVFIFVILNFFDATGTLKTINIETNKITERNDDLSNSSLIIDASSTIVGSALGVSHMSAYVESCVGISQGSRTGFSTIITSLLFLLSLVLFPLFKMIPGCISGAATVFIGTIMIKSITDIEWKKPEIGLGAFFSIIFMITTYSIANGIAVGMLAYTAGCIATKQGKKVPILVWLLDVVFIAYFIAYAFI